MNPSAGSAVLAVDDDPMILALVHDALEDGGFRVIAVSNGAEALTIVQRPDEPLSALVTDVDLGRPPSGWELAKRGRELNVDLAVVYVTGANAEEWASMGVPKSVLLRKPFAPAQVVAAVAGLLNEASSSTSSP